MKAWLLPIILATLCLSGCITSRTPADPLRTTAIAGPQRVARWPTNITSFPAGFLPHIEEDPAQTPGSPVTITSNIKQRGAGVLMWDQFTFNLSTQRITPNVTTFSYYAFTDHDAIVNTMVRRTRPQNVQSANTSDITPAQRNLQNYYLQRLDMIAASQFALQFAIWPAKGPNRGVIVYQWGLDGYKFERPLVEALTADGWTLLTHNGFRWRPVSGTVIPGGVPTGQPPPPALTDAQITAYARAAGAFAATELDSIIGQYVLGHEAALGFLYEQNPSLTSLPLVVMGCSLGSLTTPALVTRLHESSREVAACVMIGSGGDLLSIVGTQWEDYYYARIRNKRGLGVPAAARKPLREEYLHSTTLDPIVRAGDIRSPLLMIHAAWDQIVPSSSGDALWNAAGKPERWTVYAGHIPMFITLRLRTKGIVDWVRDNARQSVTTPMP